MFAHSGDFSFIFLEEEVEIALLVAAGEHWVSRRPLEPSYLKLLILKLQILQKVCRKRRP
jgi:hypothetical protein